MLSQLNKLDRETPLIFVGVASLTAAVTTGLASISYQPLPECQKTVEVVRYLPAEAFPEPVKAQSVAIQPDWLWQAPEAPQEAAEPAQEEEPDAPRRRHHRRWRRG